MNQQPPSNPHQRLNIDESSIEGGQIGQAGHDIIQAQGSGSLFTRNIFNIFGQQETTATARLTRQEYYNRQALLSKVSNFWIKGVLETSLHNRGLIELGLEERSGTVARPWAMAWETSDTPKQSLPSGTKVTKIFDQMGSGRTLLILGKAGAGKTTTLLELVRDLIPRAEQDIDQLIPVVFNLSSWTSEKQTIADWLVKELITKYQVPQGIGQTWVKNQQLLLLLDGLDEVRAECREVCVQALNNFSQEYGPEIVVCSRTKDYEALSNRLCFQSAVYLRSLNLEQVHHYLASAGPDLAGLSAMIQVDTALQELTKSPLMLSIMTLAYQGMSVEDLPRMSLEERRRQLFNAYIQRMFNRRSAEQRYSKGQAKHWLIWLAQKMSQSSQTVFLIEQMQLSWVQTEAQKGIYRIGVRLILGLIVGVLHIGVLSVLYFGLAGLIRGLIIGPITGLLYGLTDGLISGLIGGFRGRLISGLISGLIFGLGFGLIFGLGFGPIPGRIFGLAYGLLYALLVGEIVSKLIRKGIEPLDSLKWSLRKGGNSLVFGLTVGLILGPATGQPQGMLYGLILGLILVVTFGFEKGSEVDRRSVPNQDIWKYAATAIYLTVTVGVSSGLLLGLIGVLQPELAEGWLQGPVKGILYGLANGLIFGMAAGLLGKHGSGIVCIKHFALRFILWCNGDIPWNYAHFLDYAAEHILLQKIGGGYVFIHRLLMEHFAEMELDQVKN